MNNCITCNCVKIFPAKVPSDFIFQEVKLTCFSCKFTDYSYILHVCFELKPLQTLWGRHMDRLMEAGSLSGFLYCGEKGEEYTSIVEINNLSWHVEVHGNPKTQLCYVKALPSNVKPVFILKSPWTTNLDQPRFLNTANKSLGRTYGMCLGHAPWCQPAQELNHQTSLSHPARMMQKMPYYKGKGFLFQMKNLTHQKCCHTYQVLCKRIQLTEMPEVSLSKIQSLFASDTLLLCCSPQAA